MPGVTALPKKIVTYAVPDFRLRHNAAAEAGRTDVHVEGAARDFSCGTSCGTAEAVPLT